MTSLADFTGAVYATIEAREATEHTTRERAQRGFSFRD